MFTVESHFVAYCICGYTLSFTKKKKKRKKATHKFCTQNAMREHLETSFFFFLFGLTVAAHVDVSSSKEGLNQVI